MFLRNTPQNTKHSLYNFRISREFRVLLMPQKITPRNPMTFPVNAYPRAKCCKMGVKCEKSDAKYHAIRFLFFALRDRFHIFCDKCIASLRQT